MYANTPKTLYGSDLLNLVGEAITIPTTGMIALCNPYGTMVDRRDYEGSALLPGQCYIRQGDVWIIR